MEREFQWYHIFFGADAIPLFLFFSGGFAHRFWVGYGGVKRGDFSRAFGADCGAILAENGISR